MATEEVKMAKKPEHVFADRSSLFTPIMTFFSNCKYFQRFYRGFFDRHDPESFYGKMCERCLGAGIRNDLVFVLDESELQVTMDAAERGSTAKAEIRSHLAENTRSLHACISQDFLPALEKLKVPDDLKVVLKCLLTALRNQPFLTTDVHNKILIPIRQVIMNCLLAPMLMDVENNAPRDCGVFDIMPERAKRKMLRNVKTIGRFLHLASTDGWSPNQLEHAAVGHRVKDAICKWINDLLRDVVDRTEVEENLTNKIKHFATKVQNFIKIPTKPLKISIVPRARIRTRGTVLKNKHCSTRSFSNAWNNAKKHALFHALRLN